jgi:hypothetical protein
MMKPSTRSSARPRTSTTTTTKKVASVALSVLGALGCLALAAGIHRDVRRPEPPAGATGPAPPGATPSCSFAAGTTMSYALRVTSEGRLDPAAGGTLPPDLRVSGPAGAGLSSDLAGRAITHDTRVFLDLQSLSGAPAGENVLLARLRELDPATAAIAGALDEPFLLKVDPACRISGFARLDSASVPAARTQQALAHELQWTMPQGRSERAVGSNNLGTFTAEFIHDRDRAGSVVTRRILRYTRLWNRLGLQPGGDDVPTRSFRKITFDGGPWFEALEGEESSQGLSMVAATTRTQVARAATPPQAFAGTPREPSRYIWEDLLPRPITGAGSGPAQALDEAERSRLMKTTLERALADFNALTEGGASLKDTWPRMARLLEVRPELAKPLARKLVTGEVPPGSTAGIFVALGNADVPEARDALLAINRDPTRHMMDRSRAAFALVPRKDVGVEFARDLRHDARAMSTGATRPQRIYAREAALALGMMGGLKGDSQPEVKREALASVSELLGSGKRWYDLRPAFAMIANLGDPAVLPLAEGYTRSPDAKVRQASTVVTRRMKPADTRGFTLAWLQRETDPDVKRRLYANLQMQTFDAHEVIADDLLAQAVADLKSDPPPQMLTRQSILRAIRDAVEADPTKLPPLRAVLRDQLGFEIAERSGLADLLAPLLPREDLARALQTAQQQKPGEHQRPTPPPGVAAVPTAAATDEVDLLPR